MCNCSPAPQALDFLPSVSLGLWKLPPGRKRHHRSLTDWAKLRGDPSIHIPKNQHNSGYFLNSSCTKSQSKLVRVSWLLTAAICIGLKAGQLREQVLNTTQLQIKHPPTQCFPRFILVYGGFPKLKEKLYSESPNHSKSTELSYDL